MNSHARSLFCTLQALFTTRYQRDSFRALIALFLRADGRPHLRAAITKSASALSRFLNNYAWNARAVARHTRAAALNSLLGYYAHRRGRQPRLLILIDLTTLEKAGRFEKLDLVRTLHKKRGVHLVMLYLVAGPLRLPWGWRVWRGRGQRTPSELALALLHTLPTGLTQRFRPLVLADSGFGTRTFLEGVHAMGFDAVVGMRRNRRLQDDRHLKRARSGETVLLRGVAFPVTVARYRVRRRGGGETRYLVATFPASGRLLSRWGRRRWRIEGFFKTAKGRFGLARFGQGTRRGVYRFLVLSLLAFTLAQWGVWDAVEGSWPDWGEAAARTRLVLLPEVVRAELLAGLARLRTFLEAAGMPLET